MLLAVLLAVTGALPTGVVLPTRSLPPAEDYALYLPSRYEPGRRWPVVYLLDARGRALVPLELFREGAEKHGYVLASAYGSASDGPAEPTIRAFQSMFDGTHRQLALDDRRLYVAGFSGTSRLACFLAQGVPGSIRAVIGAGGGFPLEAPPSAETAFLFFGVVGDRDFNYGEMQGWHDQLTRLGKQSRLLVYAGGHQWMPSPLATRALEWLDREAMQAGLMPKDAAFLDALWAREREEAEALAGRGRVVEGQRLHAALAREFAGLRAVGEAAARAEALAGSRPFAEALREREKGAAREEAERERAQRRIGAALAPDEPPLVRSVLGDLRVPERRRQAEGDGEEADAAGRFLAWLAVQTGFYMPRELTERGQHRRAAYLLEIATEVAPDAPVYRYRLAVALARDGSRGRVLEELERAVELGWRDAEALEAEEAFAPLRRQDGFQRLVAALKEKAKAAP